MTRDEAIKVLMKSHGSVNYSWAGQWVDAFEGLGVLKLDEPKNATDTFCAELRKQGYRNSFLEKDVEVALVRNGLKIVEK